nr:hydrolase [Lacticaseibacillus yichunensis]
MKRIKMMAVAMFTVLGGLLAFYSSDKPVEAIARPATGTQIVQADQVTSISDNAAASMAANIVATNDLRNQPNKIVITVGVNPYAVAEEKREAKIAAAKKAAAARKAAAAKKAAAEKLAAQKAAAAKAAAALAAQKAAAAKAAAAKAAAAKAAAASQAATTTTVSNTTGSNKGTFKLSFYDPAAMGSSLGYGGVAANLSVFPRGTQLKIVLSNGTVWYRTVNDTGGFAYANPNQLDVAMPNSQIPSAGILYATVYVVG